MQPIDYFRRQAKNLLQDLQTRKLDPDRGRFVYAPRFFDIDALILSGECQVSFRRFCS